MNLCAEIVKSRKEIACKKHHRREQRRALLARGISLVRLASGDSEKEEKQMQLGFGRDELAKHASYYQLINEGFRPG